MSLVSGYFLVIDSRVINISAEAYELEVDLFHDVGDILRQKW